MTLSAAPLSFTPAYQTVVWGGRRISELRSGVPDGPIGESWDLADQPRGMSVVSTGVHAGRTLRELTAEHGRELVGARFAGGDFPLLIKLLDCQDRLSVQVHPDDALAKSLKVGVRGKTECWLMVRGGGELFVGTKPGVTAASFEAARQGGNLESVLNRFECADGDFFFLAARTVHALGRGCLLYEVQQSCDITFRVDDWGRLGLDGKPRPLHVKESLATIDFETPFEGPSRAVAIPSPAGGTVRELVSCDYFEVAERRADTTSGGDAESCSVITCLEGEGVLSTSGGELPIRPMTTLLVPALAGGWKAQGKGLRLMEARPRF